MAAATTAMDDSWLPEHLVMDEIVRKLPIHCLFKLRYEVSESNSDIIFKYILDQLFGVYHHDDDDCVLIRVSDKTFYEKSDHVLWNHLFCLYSSASSEKFQLRFSFTPEGPAEWLPADIEVFYDEEILRVHVSSYKLAGYVNGLLVFYDVMDVDPYPYFWMWNPVTDSYKMSAQCITPNPPSKGSPFCIRSDDATFGCAFCADSKDLKVVCIRPYGYFSSNDSPPGRRMEIESDGSWSDETESDSDESESYTNESELYNSDPGEGLEFFDANDEFFDTGDGYHDGISDFLDANDDFMDHHDSFIGINVDTEETSCILVRDVNLQPDYIVEVYSLNTDSWRRVAVDPQIFLEFPPYRMYPRTTKTQFTPQIGYTNSSFSWLVCHYDGNGGVTVKVLTFHMTTEVFQVTSLPDAILGDTYDYSTPRYGRMNKMQDPQERSPIQLSNGIIALVIPHRDESFDSFDIWVLLEYGVQESWTRLCTVGPFSGVRRILGFWKKGKVFMESNSGELVLADIVTNKIIQNLGIQGCPGGFSQIIPY